MDPKVSAYIAGAVYDVSMVLSPFLGGIIVSTICNIHCTIITEVKKMRKNYFTMPNLTEDQFLYNLFRIVLPNKTCIDSGLNYCPCCIFAGRDREAGHPGPPLFPADHSTVRTSSLHHCLPPRLYPVAGSHLLLCSCESC